jgi:hypothetical protein
LIVALAGVTATATPLSTVITNVSVTPPAAAEIVIEDELPALPTVTGKTALLAPAGTVTLDGIVTVGPVVV